ncbi:MAG: glycosyltransferase family 2 protein [Deltaproteobacteria bacterium]|nr:glycosyltransferase family 2 protein [Deltaproteobacteria bacterium]
MKELSIIIVNWNTKDYLKKCLDSILENLNGVDYEVIVVDNGSSDMSQEMLKTNYNRSPFKLVLLNENSGYAKGNNIGYEHSNGEIILLLNPDIIVLPNSIQNMMKYIKENPKAGIVGCHFLNPDGSMQYHYRRFLDIFTLIFYYSYIGNLLDRFIFKNFFSKRHKYMGEDFSRVKIIDQLSGSALMMFKRVIKELDGLFDEKMVIFFNDVDLCKRVWDIGYEIHVIPDAKVIHFGARSINQLSIKEYKKALFEGLLAYLKKHRDPKRFILPFIFPILFIRRKDKKFI